MGLSYVHLRVHSEYSLCDGIVRVPSLVERLASQNMPACALTDQTNLFAAVKFYKAMLSKGLKPLIGCDLPVMIAPGKIRRLTLLCQNTVGYQNLCALITEAYQNPASQSMVACPLQELTLARATGLIAIAGGYESNHHGESGGHSSEISLLEPLMKILHDLFPTRLYLEVSRTGRSGEEAYLQAIVKLAQQQHLPVVASNAVCFLEEADFAAHDVRVAIAEGRLLRDKSDVASYNKAQYLKTAAEMATLFADIPSALENTVIIAKRCNFQFDLTATLLPRFGMPEQQTPESYLTIMAQEGLNNRAIPAAAEERYQHRLNEELTIIERMGFASYFLIVADFIRWAKEQGIPVGPGRGSGAGSLVAYALGITGLDPMPYDLLFERFLNPERVSMPDFDIDFCMDRRDEVINYVAERYGKSSVAQIITFGTMAARAVVRDVGRVLGLSYGFVDKLAKLIPFELGITLTKAIAQEQILRDRYQNEEDVKQLLDLAKNLEGIARNAGKHAGGVVIAPAALTEFTPLYCESPGESAVTQFDKNDVEAIGLVKFDFLGLRTLTIIDWAMRTINAARQKNQLPPLDIDTIPLNDAKTYATLKSAETTAIFQLESRGMKDLIKRLQPSCFEDIIPLVALFRPGPLQSGMVDDFIDRKQGRAPVAYLHPLLETVLRPTYGIIVYQEQVMQIAQVLAGYSLGSADLLRRAMGKKKASEMAKQRQIFIAGAKQKGVAEETSMAIFDLMEKFADYGFNKSHSAAYALVTYQTAFLKTHYPAAFMAAVLSSDMDNTDKVVSMLEECKGLGLSVLVPNVNSSQYAFSVKDEKTLYYGLGAIKGIGAAACQHLIEEREKHGPYTNLFSFCQRLDTHKCNRRFIEALIRSGSLDCFGQTRRTLLANNDAAMKGALQQRQNQQSGQLDLFQQFLAPTENTIQYVKASAESDEERLIGEKETLGHYISGHPLDRYRDELRFLVKKKISEIRANEAQKLCIAGFIVHYKTIFTKRGERIAFLTLDDGSARLEVAVFAEAYQTYRHLLTDDQLVIVEGEVSVDAFTGNCRVTCQRLLTIEQARLERAAGLMITIDEAILNDELIKTIQNVLLPFQKGPCPLSIYYQRQSITTELKLGQQWRIQPKDELITLLRDLLGKQNVIVQYFQ